MWEPLLGCEPMNYQLSGFFHKNIPDADKTNNKKVLGIMFFYRYIYIIYRVLFYSFCVILPLHYPLGLYQIKVLIFLKYFFVDLVDL